jgi:hypothetical protein
MKQKLWASLFILLAAMLCFLPTCDDSPSDSPQAESDYDIYFREFGQDGKFFVFNTKSLSIVDSFYLPYWGAWPELSADGEYMLFPDGDLLKLSIVDMQTKELVTQLDMPGLLIEVSPDNRYFALYDNDSVHIFDAHAFQQVFADTAGFWSLKFSLDGRHLYWPTWSGDIYCLNLDTVPFSKRIIDYPQGRPQSVVASKDGKYLFVVVWEPYFPTRFEVYNIALDSVIFSAVVPISIYYIIMDITPDGNNVILANGEPNFSFEGPSAPKIFYIFDANTLKMETIIPTFGVDPDLPNGLPPWFFVITPDSKWLVSGGMGIIAIDLESRSVKKLIEYPDKYMDGVTCRKIIK